MQFNYLLPIGSVVLPKKEKRKLVIVGVKATEEGDVKEYDYIGVLYPEGDMGKGSMYYLNHGDIKKVYHRGYENEERADFIRRLEDFYRDGKK